MYSESPYTLKSVLALMLNCLLFLSTLLMFPWPSWAPHLEGDFIPVMEQETIPAVTDYFDECSHRSPVILYSGFFLKRNSLNPEVSKDC